MTDETEKVLKCLRDENEELIRERDGGWSYGYEPTNGKLAMKLIWLGLVLETPLSTRKVKRFVITEEGRKILEDVEYVPEILRRLEKA